MAVEIAQAFADQRKFLDNIAVTLANIQEDVNVIPLEMLNGSTTPGIESATSVCV
jgi:hypothetical protein